MKAIYKGGGGNKTKTKNDIKKSIIKYTKNY